MFASIVKSEIKQQILVIVFTKWSLWDHKGIVLNIYKKIYWLSHLFIPNLIVIVIVKWFCSIFSTQHFKPCFFSHVFFFFKEYRTFWSFQPSLKKKKMFYFNPVSAGRKHVWLGSKLFTHRDHFAQLPCIKIFIFTLLLRVPSHLILM